MLQVRRAVAKRLSEGGAVKCPCCRRTARMRVGHISASMARSVLKAYQAGPREPFQCRTVDARDQNGDYAKLRYWGLIERAGRKGWWRLTPLGRAFARGEAEVPGQILTYDRKLYAVLGEPVSIADCLAKGGDDYDAAVARAKGRAK